MSAGLTVLTAAVEQTRQYSFDLAFVVNKLPLWFLVFALFLPRLAMVVAWFQGLLGPIHVALSPSHLEGLLPLLFWLLLPRALVMYLIYLDQGIHFWFFLHLLVALLVWGGSGGYQSRRRRRRDDY
jgi:hypothetical protein